MPTRTVVIVAYPGMQSLDAVGPFEVFAGANRVAGGTGPTGATRCAWSRSTGPGPLGQRDGPGHGAAARRRTRGSTPWCCRGGPGPRGPGGRRPDGVDHRGRPPVPAGGHGVHRARSSPPRPASSTAGGSPPTGPAPSSWPASTRPSTSMPTPSTSGTGSTGPAPGSRPASTWPWPWWRRTWAARWPRRWPAGWSCSSTGPGGQTQFSSPVWVPRAERSTVRAVQSLVEAAPAGDHRLPALAAAAAMSVRHFTRVFTDEVGETPGRFVERVRARGGPPWRWRPPTDTLEVVAAVRLRLRRDLAPDLPTPAQRHPRQLPAPLPHRTPREEIGMNENLQVVIPLFPG